MKSRNILVISILMYFHISAFVHSVSKGQIIEPCGNHTRTVPKNPHYLEKLDRIGLSDGIECYQEIQQNHAHFVIFLANMIH